MYECIIYEHKLGDNYFILRDGIWQQVDNEFYASIVEFMRRTIRIEPCEEVYKGIAIGDDELMKNREALFNEAACQRRQKSIMFDRAKLRIGGGRSDKEFCDILDMTDGGFVRIINCKPLKDASAINYLFSQAKFYADAFLHDPIFLAEIRNYILRSNCSIKDQYLEYIKPEVENVFGAEYTVCLWLLYDQSEAEPTNEGIPLIAQYELKLMHDHLRRICKFRDVVVRFVPVKLTKYTRMRKATKKAA